MFSALVAAVRYALVCELAVPVIVTMIMDAFSIVSRDFANSVLSDFGVPDLRVRFTV